MYDEEIPTTRAQRELKEREARVNAWENLSQRIALLEKQGREMNAFIWGLQRSFMEYESKFQRKQGGRD